MYKQLACAIYCTLYNIHCILHNLQQCIVDNTFSGVARVSAARGGLPPLLRH